MAPLSEDDIHQLQLVCGLITLGFNKEDKILVRNAIPGIYLAYTDTYWECFL